MNDNIVSLVPEAKNEIPESDYVITTNEGEDLFATGFLLFTSHHIAVMKDTPAGALPVLVVPLGNVKFAELVEDDEEDQAPF